MKERSSSDETPMEPSIEESGLKSAAEIALERAAQTGTTPETLSQGDLQSLSEQAAKANDYWERLLRAQADLENFRKRSARERQDLVKFSNEKLLMELLAPLDHFEMGLQSLRNLEEKDPIRTGMEMVFNQFQQFLKSQGVEEIDALGQNFDPALHEAVGHVESDLPEGQVFQQTRKGYRLKEKVLRPATVLVSKGPGHS